VSDAELGEELVRLASADNFRDVSGPDGAYVAADGTPLRRGVAYRSNELQLTEGDAGTVAGLGITAIYLNPIFEAESMHKYDTSDFRHVDDNFGVKGDLGQLAGETDDPTTWKWSKSDLIFLDFVKEARRQGFKVIIDGVFNHVGKAHPFFQDVVKNGKGSKYADWFEISDWGTGGEPGTPGGIQWKAWDKANGELPVFKKDPARGLAPGPYAHIMAITKRWLAPDGDVSRGVDGFRLDVPGDIPHPFWVEWRKLVKSTNPDAYITGEIWQWAQAWLGGDQFDAVMNYQFAMAAQDFFVDVNEAIRPSDFASRLTRVAYAYPFQVALAQQNLFDSHDTDRLASMFVNPDRPYDGRNRLQDNGPDYNPAEPTPQQRRRMLQAVAMQMLGPVHPSSMATMAGVALGIIIGTRNGVTRVGPRSIRTFS